MDSLSHAVYVHPHGRPLGCGCLSLAFSRAAVLVTRLPLSCELMWVSMKLRDLGKSMSWSGCGGTDPLFVAHPEARQV